MKRKTGSVLIFIGALMLLIAAAIWIYDQLDAQRAEEAASTVLKQLESETAQNELMTIPTVERKPGFEEDGEEDATMDTIEIDGNDYIGTLSIPRFGLELPVMAEWSYAGLKTAPGLYYGSVWTNDMVICAHNYDRHFGNLKYLEAGDSVIFTDVNGNVFNYEVLEVVTLQPTAVTEMKTGDWWDLTLFTCTIGGATRVTVRCAGVDADG